MFETALELALGAEDVDEAEASAADGIVARPILFGVGYENASADVLDVERSEIAGNGVVIESLFA